MNSLVDFRHDLVDVPCHDDAATLRVKSRDFFWFSPILKDRLDGRTADLIVAPRSREEVIRVAAAAARHRVPLTVRGGGTGNYGQAVPLEGGIVLDMTGLGRILSAAPGVATIEAGAAMLDVDRALAATGWELRFHPSTRKQATIGGFVAGGAAGAGSCTWGQISDPGAVIAAEVVTVEEEPRVVRLEGRDVLKVLHAYGVNGIIVSVTVPLAPRHPWAERIIAFSSLAAAACFGQVLTECDGIAKKLVSVLDPRIPPMIGRLAKLVPSGAAAAIVMVSEPQVGALAEIAADHGGEVVFSRDAAAAERAAFTGEGSPGPLYEYTWNHTTLHAMKRHPDITYLQLRFPPESNLELVDRVAEVFGDELLLHLEFQRRFGRVTCTSLPLLRYSTQERLYEVVAALNELGVAVSDPHTYVLNDAGWKRIDAPQPEFKRLADPHGLMNPGKLVEAYP